MQKNKELSLPTHCTAFLQEQLEVLHLGNSNDINVKQRGRCGAFMNPLQCLVQQMALTVTTLLSVAFG